MLVTLLCTHALIKVVVYQQLTNTCTFGTTLVHLRVEYNLGIGLYFSCLFSKESDSWLIILKNIQQVFNISKHHI